MSRAVKGSQLCKFFKTRREHLTKHAVLPAPCEASGSEHRNLKDSGLSLVFATDRRKSMLTPIIATVPKHPPASPLFATHPTPSLSMMDPWSRKMGYVPRRHLASFFSSTYN